MQYEILSHFINTWTQLLVFKAKMSGFDHKSESVTKSKTEILESGHKSGFGLTSGSQNTKKVFKSTHGVQTYEFSKFSSFFSSNLVEQLFHVKLRLKHLFLII